MKLKDLFLDLLFPKFCLGCGQEGEWLCAKCLAKVVAVQTQVCPTCGRISAKGKYCVKCRQASGLKGIIISGYYEEGPLKEIIHNFKYNHIMAMAELLSFLMAQALKNNLPGRDCLLTAVPMHFLRKSQRGYNQAEVLAQNVANRLHLPTDFYLLKKSHSTLPQVKTSGKKRRENVKNSFQIRPEVSLAGRRLILVDDVTTTGATLKECACLLKKAGAKEVWGLVAAKG